MKPAPFKYIAAVSLEHALALKAEYGDDAKFLAGGQSLMPAINFRLARPAILVDINKIEELAGIRPSGAIGRCSATRLLRSCFL
jgi:CO/xanthine dehydrogenase FAD-binding subunit